MGGFVSSAAKKLTGGVIGGSGSSSQSMNIPAENDAEVQAALEAERKRAALRQGRGSTILTGGSGVEIGSKTTLGA